MWYFLAIKRNNPADRTLRFFEFKANADEYKRWFAHGLPPMENYSNYISEVDEVRAAD